MKIVPCIISLAEEPDIVGVKEIVDAHRFNFGFIPRAAFVEALRKGWLLVAKTDNVVVGFVRFRHRRDKTTVLYEIGVAEHMKRQGIGRELVRRVAESARQHNQSDLKLKCPVNLPANNFYCALGFELVRVDKGKGRELNIWRLGL